MKKCLGCNKNKPANDFGTTGNARALCSKCRSGTVVRTNKGTGRKTADGVWIGNIFAGIADFLGSLVD
ncbi:hypothetical protein SEA_SPILLED_160 [Streptomyces phage Spilled]|uniref:Uncharacterized protein n=1 Tax=Streptomyces phage Karimac TaxID=2283303 RepID=A0A345MHG9_9CAUD|nr:hypothetical protein HWB80_gp146 [Streptomyces phage Karimac]AXH70000.1 hypothetical protein SEA_KARIMAC_155 [Streptomyces phage Karimac]UVK60034.1 hypothetical protein SEA_SPILLED_160 [Streptomyces phage Spilled]